MEEPCEIFKACFGFKNSYSLIKHLENKGQNLRRRQKD